MLTILPQQLLLTSRTSLPLQGTFASWETGDKGLGRVRRQVQGEHTGPRYQALQSSRAHTVEDRRLLPAA